MNKVKSMKAATKALVGKTLPTNINGHAGRKVEDILEEEVGYEMNRGEGCDVKVGGSKVEIKSRANEATSPHTVCSMRPSSIVRKSYKQSPVFEKLQQQFRVTTKDQIVTEARIYDFSDSYIRDVIERDYETARKNLTDELNKGNDPSYIVGGRFGYFEKTTNGKSYSFRIRNKSMKELVAMSKSTAGRILEWA